MSDEMENLREIEFLKGVVFTLLWGAVLGLLWYLCNHVQIGWLP